MRNFVGRAGRAVDFIDAVEADSLDKPSSGSFSSSHDNVSDAQVAVAEAVDMRAFGVTVRSVSCAREREAVLSAQRSDWMAFTSSDSSLKMIGVNEMVSLRALIAYVASISSRSEFAVERQFCDRFGIPNVKCLAFDDYDLAIRFLVELSSAQA